jgi:hypothetical protein
MGEKVKTLVSSFNPENPHIHMNDDGKRVAIIELAFGVLT